VLPADGVILGRNDLAINEKLLTGETVNKKKTPEYVIEGSKVVSSPILFRGHLSSCATQSAFHMMCVCVCVCVCV
jgi:magnesium-transporting ATPase (P-type)